MKQDELVSAFLEEIRLSRIDHRDGLEKISESLNALNESNILHSERVEELNGTVRASAEALSAMSVEMKQQKTVIRFMQYLIILLVFTLIVVAGAQRVFEYSTYIRLP